MAAPKPGNPTTVIAIDADDGGVPGAQVATLALTGGGPIGWNRSRVEDPMTHAQTTVSLTGGVPVWIVTDARDCNNAGLGAANGMFVERYRSTNMPPTWVSDGGGPFIATIIGACP